jgi:hypothetical protein
MIDQETIIKLAREAGLPIQIFQLERFAALVADAEREACAKVCDDINVEYDGEDVLATWCSAAIRARGQWQSPRMCPATYYECHRECADGGCKDFSEAHQRSQP